jgi:Flp pilus assembly protein TadD
MSTLSRETQVLSQLAYLYLMQGYVDRAALIYNSLHILEPAALPHLRGVAVAHARAGRNDKALAALDELALRGAVDATFYALRARVLADLGRLDEAQAAMRSHIGLRSKRESGTVRREAAGRAGANALRKAG